MTRYARYRAPRHDGGLLVDPPRETLRGLVLENQQTRAASLRSLEFAGVSGTALAESARSALLAAARVTGDPASPLVLSGHQPELFHPGVWFKNFLLASLVREIGASGVHLRIDSDLCRTVSVRVPSGPRDSPRAMGVAYDRASAPFPYEERRVLDHDTFRSFPRRVADALAEWIDQPLVEVCWPAALEAAAITGNLGDALSESRCYAEERWGVHNPEAPLSAVCDAEPFRRFAIELLLRAERVRAAYNGALGDYRHAHKLRNPAQPTPDLAEQAGWIETPLWVWTHDDPRRRALWARVAGEEIELGDGAHAIGRLDASPDLALEQLEGFRKRGVKLRSRALLTTLYCRLIVGDLFLHGIGGAKYDQVTDDLSRRLLGVALPPHATATATLWLPLDREQRTNESPRGLKQRLRELRYHPENFVDPDDSAAAEWAQKKAGWVTEPKTPHNAATRHREIEAANLKLAARLESERKETERRITESLRNEQSAAMLDSREYAFCLFPEAILRERLTSLANI